MTAVSEGFYDAIDKEYRCVVLDNKLTQDKIKKDNIIFMKNGSDDDTDNIFQSFNFEAVVFFSQVLDGEKKIFDELEKLEYILYLCRKRNVSSFIYITGNRNTAGSAHRGRANNLSSRHSSMPHCQAANSAIPGRSRSEPQGMPPASRRTIQSRTRLPITLLA